MIRWNWYL